MSYTTIAALRAMDGMDDEALFPDSKLEFAIDIAVSNVEDYTGQVWGTPENPVPARIEWCVLTLARQHCLDSVSRIPDRALQMQSEFGSVQLAQAGGNWRPTSLPEVNAILNRARVRLPFILM